MTTSNTLHAPGKDASGNLLPLRLCSACQWKRDPQGGWCYMFASEPTSAYCGQFKADPAHPMTRRP